MFGRFFGRSPNKQRQKQQQRLIKETDKTKATIEEEDECLSFVETARNKSTMRAIRDMRDISPGFATVQKLRTVREYMKSKRENEKVIGDAIYRIKKDVRKNSKAALSEREINKLMKNIDKFEEREDEYAIFLEEITNGLEDCFFINNTSTDSDNDDENGPLLKPPPISPYQPSSYSVAYNGSLETTTTDYLEDNEEEKQVQLSDT